MPRNPFWTASDASLTMGLSQWRTAATLSFTPDQTATFWDNHALTTGTIQGVLTFEKVTVKASNLYSVGAIGTFAMDVAIFDDSGYLLTPSSSGGFIQNWRPDHDGTYYIEPSWHTAFGTGTFSFGIFEDVFGDGINDHLTTPPSPIPPQPIPSGPTATIVSNNAVRPYSAVVHIDDTIAGSGFSASGVLIAPNEVLTASHVVWSRDTFSSASNVSITPAENGGSDPFGSVGVSNFHYFQINDSGGVISAATTHSDYALLHLSSPVGSQTGTMLLDSGFQGGTIHVSGYPDSTLFNGSQLTDLSSVTATTDNTDHILNFSPNGTYNGSSQLIVTHGSSGGPLWYSDTAGTAHVVGLVSAGNSTSEDAAWITPDVQAQIVGWYLQDNPSVAPAWVPTAEAALIDPSYYLIHNPDILATGTDPIQHFVGNGWQERRNPDSLFDTNYYLTHNSDIATAGIDPLQHYALFGWREGRDPSAGFSTNHYLAANPDVRLTGLDPLQHYLQFGIAEHRSLA